jgi:hypothetical protein
MFCCVAAAGTGLLAASRERRRRLAIGLWTLGFVLYLVHVGLAFHFYHNWRHTAAYEHTAEQTREVVGWDWGGGIWLNYLLTACWAAEMAWRWRPGSAVPRRLPAAMAWAWYGFFAFMAINATVVFATGPMQSLSLAAVVGLTAIAVRRLV